MAELRTGITFISLARTEMDSDHAKIKRHCQNALKAYESYLRFRTRVALSDSDIAELEKTASALRSALQQLGEKVA